MAVRGCAAGAKFERVYGPAAGRAADDLSRRRVCDGHITTSSNPQPPPISIPYQVLDPVPSRRRPRATWRSVRGDGKLDERLPGGRIPNMRPAALSPQSDPPAVISRRTKGGGHHDRAACWRRARPFGSPGEKVDGLDGHAAAVDDDGQSA